MEIFNAAAGGDVGDGGADGIDGLVGRKELRAVDRVGRGPVDTPCRDIGNGALGANSTDADRRGRSGALEGVGRAVDHCIGRADRCHSRRAGTQGHVTGTRGRRRAIAQCDVPDETARARGGTVAERNRALADRLVVVADRDCAGRLVGGSGTRRAIAVGDVVGTAGEGASAARIARIAYGDRTVAVGGIAGADGDSLAACRNCIIANGNRFGRGRLGRCSDCNRVVASAVRVDAQSDRLKPAGDRPAADCCAANTTGGGGLA